MSTAPGGQSGSCLVSGKQGVRGFRPSEPSMMPTDEVSAPPRTASTCVLSPPPRDNPSPAGGTLPPCLLDWNQSAHVPTNTVAIRRRPRRPLCHLFNAWWGSEAIVHDLPG